MSSKPLGGWGRKFDVLEHGFVRVVDRMGDDSAIVQAARVSYGKGTKTVHEDEGLIRYLMRHRHTTPFEMCEIKLHVKVPMDTWRQWIRHRTANVNEYSTRYSEAIDACQTTGYGEWRIQGKGNRQGSGGFLPEDPTGKSLTRNERKLQEHAREVYQHRLDCGVAREQARKDLPLSNYTEAYWKIDLHNLLNFLSLRMDAHAQDEIRQYANVIAAVVQEWVPLTWNAFRDYRLEGMHLSKRDIDAIWLRQVDSNVVTRTLLKWGWIKKNDPMVTPVFSLTKNRERDECERKLHKLDMSVPWANLRHAPVKK